MPILSGAAFLSNLGYLPYMVHFTSFKPLF
jgi:hypothetical protein